MDKRIHSLTPLYYTAGICRYQKPFLYKGEQEQSTIGTISIYSKLTSAEKRASLSAYIENLEYSTFTIRNAWSLENIVHAIQQIHTASEACVHISMPLSFSSISPITQKQSSIVYTLSFALTYTEEALIPVLSCRIPLVSVCPCSLDNLGSLAHMQRVYLMCCLNSDASFMPEDCIFLMQNVGSEKSYSLLKQLDEKYIIENAYANPRFAEDIVKAMASSLHNHNSVQGFMVYVQSFESLHAHDIFAYVEENYTDFSKALYLQNYI